MGIGFACFTVKLVFFVVFLNLFEFAIVKYFILLKKEKKETHYMILDLGIKCQINSLSVHEFTNKIFFKSVYSHVKYRLL